MNNLDDLAAIKSLDKKNVLDSIKQLPLQVKQAWEESYSINYPDNFKKVNNIVIAGMGGSSYGARIIKSLYDGAEYTKVPIELANGYWLPGYVDEDTLVVLSSYSGNTEETLTIAKEAIERKAKITGITSGGQLADFLKTNYFPSYIFNPVHNPSAQPRIGVGYMVMGLIGMLTKLEKIPVASEEIKSLISFLSEKNSLYNEKVATADNSTKQAALRLENKIPVIVVADFLEGVAYAIRNPFHETAKQFALYFSIPELNHHLLEGLSFPLEIKKLLHFLFIESDIYDKRNINRMKLTKDVIAKNRIAAETIILSGKSALTQTMELTQLASWVTFYLAILHGKDPSEIPWVDYFKEKLKGMTE